MIRLLPLLTTLFISFNTFSQVEIDQPVILTGGMGQSKISGLEDVPVSDHDAANKKYVDDQIAATAGNSPRQIGELFGGGVVFAVFKNSDGMDKGLAVSLSDNSASTVWSNIMGPTVGTNPWNGASNTTAIVNQPGNNEPFPSIDTLKSSTW